MKNILIVMLCMAFVPSYAQQKKSTKIISGVALQVGGLAVAAGGYSIAHNNGDNKKSVPLYAIGSVLFLAGTVFEIQALAPHKNRRVSFYGNGFSYKLCKQ